MAASRLLHKACLLWIPSRHSFASLAPKLPRHRSPPGRRKAPKTEGDAADQGQLPEWLFEDRPVWLQALLLFLREPDLIMVRLGGAARRMGRRPATGSLPELKELQLPEGQLRDWALEELREAADAGRKVRAVAVLATEADHAADAVEVLRSMGFKRVANLRTKAFLQQLQTLPGSVE
ncbi:unnamed protein product [Symbiodinium natans]|uniref:Uncharacterized protein n=1 Tax=Symbiodinium natans TaxID=878477 RepID=A0A812PY51_9DINO|nr:unnamed protein product [Symbiodinium natans]